MSTPTIPMQDDAHLLDSTAPAKRGLVSAGVGVGVLGATLLGLRWLIRPATKSPVPESISPWFFSTRAFQSSRGQMIYHESGSGPGSTLLFIHDLGVGASSYEWSKIYTAFADNHRVLALDLIGFGESDRPQRRLTREEYILSLAEFIDFAGGGDEGVRRPVVVIASGMSAGLAALLTARHPGLVSRLIFWMPSGKARAPWYLNLAARLPTVDRFVYRNLLARRGAIRRSLATRSHQPALTEISHEAVEVTALCAQQYQAEFAVYGWLQGRFDVSLDAALSGAKAPVTLLFPEHFSPGAGQTTATLATAGESRTVRKLPGTGPLALFEAPGTVAGALKEELRSERR